MTTQDWVDDAGGVVSTNQVAVELGVSPAVVRAWASDNGVPMIGNAFAFTSEHVEALADEVLETDEDEEDYDEEDYDEEEDEDEEDEEYEEY